MGERRSAHAALHQALEDCRHGVPAAVASRTAMLLQLALDSVPRLPLHDRVVLSVVQLAVERDLADVKSVAENTADRVLFKSGARHDLSGLRDVGLVRPTTPVEFLNDRKEGAALEVEVEDFLDLPGLLVVDDELLFLDVEAEHRPATGPHPLLPSRCHLVTGALRDDLPLELREAPEHVEQQPADAG